MRADVGLPAKVRPADRVARIVLGAPSGQAAVAEAARKEKVCEQPIGRCKAGVTEAGKTAPATGKIPACRPVAPSARPKLKTLPSHRAGQRPSCSAGKAEAPPGPFKDPAAIRTVEGMPASKVLQTA